MNDFQSEKPLEFQLLKQPFVGQTLSYDVYPVKPKIDDQTSEVFREDGQDEQDRSETMRKGLNNKNGLPFGRPFLYQF